MRSLEDLARAKKYHPEFLAETKPNVPLLLATLSFIQAEPRLWDQSTFIPWPQFDAQGQECGTACCFAGNALLLAGFKRLTNPQDIKRRAAKVLGLDYVDASRLFYAGNRLYEIAEMVEDLIAGQAP